MPRTFDIRLTRSTGFAAIFEPPANTFRWRGPASLSARSIAIRLSAR